jgi:hypothetical protein
VSAEAVFSAAWASFSAMSADLTAAFRAWSWRPADAKARAQVDSISGSRASIRRAFSADAAISAIHCSRLRSEEMLSPLSQKNARRRCARAKSGSSSIALSA